jgi:8-oxo-dGTP diphosphatase
MNTVRVGIGVLLFNPEKKLLLGKRINSHGDGMWAPPGGHLEFGESFEECAIRELFEETNITIETPRFVSLTNDIFHSENKHYISIFMGKNLASHPTIINNEPHKIAAWDWFPLNALPENLFLPLQNLLTQPYIWEQIS